eukprot:TRINITY_DN13840_c0_g1_i2.p1 TRINITY_DN13840_c0_g1~~TRINITY_DN13840_c0_g1_i2.p1  ORF type:complete len:335 (-),score=68.04 TRINITY_DN13840_c0_g1_i2:36-1040(-)
MQPPQVPSLNRLASPFGRPTSSFRTGSSPGRPCNRPASPARRHGSPSRTFATSLGSPTQHSVAASSHAAYAVAPAPAVDGTGDRLSELSQRFQSFERQVEADTKARKQTEESTLEHLSRGVQRLLDGLEQATQARSRGCQELQASLEPKLAEHQSKLEAHFLTHFDNLHSLIEAVSDRTSTVEKDFIQSRKRYIAEMEAESAETTANLNSFRKNLENELRTRRERERKLEDRMRTAFKTTAEKIERDDKLAERKYAQLLRDADESVRTRDAASQRYQEQMQRDIAVLRAALSQETQARTQADDDIVAALNHYTKELQRAVGTVSHGALEAALRF